MQQANSVTNLFRTTLLVALIIVTYATTSQLTHPGVTSVNDKLGHAVTFFILAFLLDFSLPHLKFNWAKISALITYGVLIECVQYFIPYRSFSLLDMLADTIGVILYLILIPLFKRFPILKSRWAVE